MHTETHLRPSHPATGNGDRLSAESLRVAHDNLNAPGAPVLRQGSNSVRWASPGSLRAAKSSSQRPKEYYLRSCQWSQMLVAA